MDAIYDCENIIKDLNVHLEDTQYSPKLHHFLFEVKRSAIHLKADLELLHISLLEERIAKRHMEHPEIFK